MRKYQQLCLVVISLISITCLLVYRSENGRLKYVLEVVNFFGQKEPIKEENLFVYISPFPTWQRIGNGFHAYSSFWHNDALAQGGEITTLVVGLKHSSVSFTCEAELSGDSATIIAGKFGFIREEVKISQAIANGALSAPVNKESTEDFIIYRFICKIGRGLGTPRKIIFTDQNTKAKHAIGVRDFGLNIPKHQLVSCVNLLTPHTPKMKHFVDIENNQLDYFYHHHVLGVDEFIVYDSEAVVSSSTKKLLLANGIRANILPFNFPFEMDKNFAKINKIVELDCELRTLNISKYFIVAEPNEYLYADSYLKSGNSSFLLFDTYSYPDSNRFEIKTNSVCMNKSINQSHLVSENLFVADAVDANTERFLLFRPKINRIDSRPITGLPKSRLFVNRYLECADEDAKLALHHTWPSTIDRGFAFYLRNVNVDVTNLKNKNKS